MIVQRSTGEPTSKWAEPATKNLKRNMQIARTIPSFLEPWLPSTPTHMLGSKPQSRPVDKENATSCIDGHETNILGPKMQKSNSYPTTFFEYQSEILFEQNSSHTHMYMYKYIFRLL